MERKCLLLNDKFSVSSIFLDDGLGLEDFQSKAFRCNSRKPFLFTKRRHVEFATQEPSSTMLLPAEPSKKLQKVSATSAFESSPSLQSKTLPKHHSTTTPRLENAGATISGPSHGNPSAPLALKSNLSKKSSPVPSSSTSLSLQHLTVAERVSKFLKMKGDANEALAPLEVKMVTELLGLNPSAATISALDHSIQAFRSI